jgi:DNA (cytosine-5)-methyltransferase 1
VNVFSLFSGIGGIDLGFERAGHRIVGQVEIDPFCRAVLAKHWPDVWRYDDVATLTGESVERAVGRPDCIAGGFPCQDISAAGKGAGIGGERSGLWFEFARLIRELHPQRVFIENVPALRTRGADRVLADLEEAGYAAWPLVVGAWAVGAPHRRDRVWIVAHAGLQGLEGRRVGSGGSGTPQPMPASGGLPPWPSRPGEPQHEWEEPRLVAYAAQSGRIRTPELENDSESERGGRRPDAAEQDDVRGARDEALAYAATRDRHDVRRFGSQGNVDGNGIAAESRPTEFPVGTPADGLPARLVRLARRRNREALKAAGNAVVPQVVEAVVQAMTALARKEGK